MPKVSTSSARPDPLRMKEGPVCSASIPMLEESAGAAPAAVATGGDPLRGGRCAEYDYGKRCLSSSRQRWGT